MKRPDDPTLAALFDAADPEFIAAVPKGLTLAWRVVHTGMKSRGDYRWPFPGNWTERAGAVLKSNALACPRQEGDGVCLAKTWTGASSGGIRVHTALLVGYRKRDVLGEDANKIRVRAAYVVDVIDIQALIREGKFKGANLSGADLHGANLRWADLGGADLGGADLGGADLGGADLHGANLRWADLGGADLHGANLRWADLDGADLGGADLGGADLGGADLHGANLGWARGDSFTTLPAGLKVNRSGLVVAA